MIVELNLGVALRRGRDSWERKIKEEERELSYTVYDCTIYIYYIILWTVQKHNQHHIITNTPPMTHLNIK